MLRRPQTVGSHADENAFEDSSSMLNMVASALSTLSPAEATTPPPLSADILVVFGIIALALILSIREPVPIDVTAIGVRSR